jgi:hypothetical protein
MQHVDVHVIHARALEDRARHFTDMLRDMSPRIRVCAKFDSDTLAGNVVQSYVDFAPIPPESTPEAARFNSLIKGLHVN